MSRFGGKDGRCTARTIAQFLIIDNVYMEYTWAGTTAKSNFSAFKETVNLTLTVIRHKHKTFTMEELSRFYQDHLRQAKVRLTRKREHQ